MPAEVAPSLTEHVTAVEAGAHATAAAWLGDTAAFALGEVESESGTHALLATLKNTTTPAELRAKAIEALGKIAAAQFSKNQVI